MNASPLRIDRLLTLYFFYPLLRIGLQGSELRIPILMYHSISEDMKHSVHPYYQTSTSPQVFAEHMKFLYENNYTVISLVDAVKMFTSQNIFSNKNSPNQPFNKSTNPQINYVVLTFDDGYRDFLTEAHPILRKYGFFATVFLPTAFVDRKFKGKECLSWEEVRELRSKGVIFGSHTVNHRKLHTLKKDDIEYELRRSKEKIENEISEPIKSFSYPYAFPEGDKKFIDNLRHMLEETGYKDGVTTRIGTTGKQDDRHFFKRLIVNYYDDMSFLEAKLNGGYDWVYRLQYITKLIRVSNN